MSQVAPVYGTCFSKSGTYAIDTININISASSPTCVFNLEASILTGSGDTWCSLLKVCKVNLQVEALHSVFLRLNKVWRSAWRVG